jgi:hypothetical protein
MWVTTLLCGEAVGSGTLSGGCDTYFVCASVVKVNASVTARATRGAPWL